ncbi:MAG: serine hydrolase [Lachnospiraceae bacterium]|nr:serine hydrolase [Lachnospiraceae bacterium]
MNIQSFSNYPTPEAAGIPSAAILRFLKALERQRVCLHSLLILRHNQIVYEANWAPMHSDELHRMYSVSKSFVSVAIGLLASERKISLDDVLADYFPEYDKSSLHPYTAKATIRDMLKMSSLFNDQPYDGAKDTDWISTFFATKPEHESGTVMCYDTMATILCTAIVERVTGQKILDYLRPRLLDPIGFSKDAWCVETPEGVSWAGSGILCSALDLAKFANVCMHYGEYEGRQLLPRDYMIEATSYQISNMINKRTFQSGYGYQFWLLPENGFACLGMGSQLAACFPDLDLVFVTTGDTQELGDRQYAALHLFFDLILPEVQDAPLASAPETFAKLQEKTRNLCLLLTPGQATHEMMHEVNDTCYLMDENPMGIRNIRFHFNPEENEGTLYYENTRSEKEIHFGLRKQVFGEFPETHYSGKRISVPLGRGYRYAASAAWDAPGTLTIYCYIIDDYLGLLKMNFAFKEDRVTVYSDKAAEWFLDDYVGSASGRKE